MNKLIVSVVSHNHAKMILDIDCLSKIAKLDNVLVYIKINCPDIYNENLIEYCSINNIRLIDEIEEYYLGFGHNNNEIFKISSKEHELKESDLFLCLNPDVDLSPEVLKLLIKLHSNNETQISTINLFKNSDFTIYDQNVRMYPTFLNFILSFVGFKNKSILDKNKISKAVKVDWAAGSFLLFNRITYDILNGFDPRYFMYCEDVDICYRAKYYLGTEVVYYPQLKAYHQAQHDNRKLFSKAMYWHISSALRFLFTKKN